MYLSFFLLQNSVLTEGKILVEDIVKLGSQTDDANPDEAEHR